jgi:hypothetical protein
MGMQNTQASYPRVCTHESQSFSPELLEYKGTGSKHLSQPNDKVFSEYNPKNFSFLKHLSDYTPYFSHSLHKILFLQERWCLGEGVSMNGYKRTGIRLCVFCTPIPLCVCRAGAPFSGTPSPRRPAKPIFYLDYIFISYYNRKVKNVVFHQTFKKKRGTHCEKIRRIYPEYS